MANRFYAHCVVGSLVFNLICNAGLYSWHEWRYVRLKKKLDYIDDEEGTFEEKRQFKIASHKLEEYNQLSRKYPFFPVVVSPPRIDFSILPKTKRPD
jgi:hypothetical protein